MPVPKLSTATATLNQPLYVLWDTVDGKLIKRDIPESKRSLEGLDPRFAYYAMEETRLPREGGLIQVDQTYYSISTVEQLDITVTPPVYRQDESTIERPLPEVLKLADNARIAATQANIPPQVSTDLLSRLAFIQGRQIAGITLTADELTDLEQFREVGNKLQANNANLANIKALIMAGQKPDITAGYVPAL